MKRFSFIIVVALSVVLLVSSCGTLASSAYRDAYNSSKRGASYYRD